MPDPRAIEFYAAATAGSDPALARAAAAATEALGIKPDHSVERAGTSDTQVSSLAVLGRFAMSHPGDARAGEELFFGKPLECHSCHAAADRGQSRNGSDLSRLGALRDQKAIIAVLLEPPGDLAKTHRPVSAHLERLSPVQFADLISFLASLK
jgi:hypothetical protein